MSQSSSPRTFVYVLASVGSAMFSRKLAGGNVAASGPSSLVATTIANAFALFVAVFISASVSGGHVNPAVTFGMAVGGHISIPLSFIYRTMQMIAAVFACLLLKVATVGQIVYFMLSNKESMAKCTTCPMVTSVQEKADNDSRDHLHSNRILDKLESG